MIPKNFKCNASNDKKVLVNQDLIFQHMSNHYRRIKEAKKAVDTSPPYCYKPHSNSPSTLLRGTRRIQSNKVQLDKHSSHVLSARSNIANSNKVCPRDADYYICNNSKSKERAKTSQYLNPPVKSSSLDLDLIDRITFDNKNGPAAYIDKDWEEVCGKVDIKSDRMERQRHPRALLQISQKRQNPNKENECEKKPSNLKEGKKVILSDKTIKSDKCFTSCSSNFQPRILKTEAVSKLRSLRVYYPPRRKQPRIRSRKTSSTEISSNFVCSCGYKWQPKEKKPEVSKDSCQNSSRDSAYNGGVSSLPGSRSPTPDHKSEKEIIEFGRTLEPDESEEDFENERPSPNKVDKSCKPRKSNKSEMSLKYKNEPEDPIKKMKEDDKYVRFIQNITSEIIEKNLYTNKALKKIMKKHMMENLNRLDKNRMMKELEFLRVQLGVPEDRSIFEIDSIMASSSVKLNRSIPVISDSAFDFVSESSCGESFDRKTSKQCYKAKTENLTGKISGRGKSREREYPKPMRRELYICRKTTDLDDSSDDSIEPTNEEKKGRASCDSKHEKIVKERRNSN